MSDAGVGLFGVNLAVGLSLALPNFATDMAKGLLANLPYGSASLVGIKTEDEALKARLAGKPPTWPQYPCALLHFLWFRYMNSANLGLKARVKVSIMRPQGPSWRQVWFLGLHTKSLIVDPMW